MKIVGEVNLSQMQVYKKLRLKGFKKKDISKKCEVCDAEYFESMQSIKQYNPKNDECHSCRSSRRLRERDELKEAIIALNKRKSKLK